MVAITVNAWHTLYVGEQLSGARTCDDVVDLKNGFIMHPSAVVSVLIEGTHNPKGMGPAGKTEIEKESSIIVEFRKAKGTKDQVRGSGEGVRNREVPDTHTSVKVT